VTLSEYLSFPFLSGASIEKGTALTNQDQIAQHTTPPLSTNQPIPDKTDHQKEVEVEDPKIVAIRERKARAAAKKRGNKRRGGDEGGGSHPKVKRRKASAARKDGSATSEHVSSSKPIGTVNPTEHATGNPFGTAAVTAESWEDRSLHIPPHDSANCSVHKTIDVHDDEETKSLRLGSFVDQSRRNLTLINTKVFQSSSGNHYVHHIPTVERTTSPLRSLQGTNVEEGESSRGRDFYVAEWFIHQICRVDSPRAWFNLARGALAQTNILERFEHLQADYDKLVETHSECEETV
ncbi:hypothetical protein Tco_0642717, partial [Tanacetum coccineum]